MNARQDRRLYGIVFASGVAGLGYEIVWIKMLAHGLGHEGPAALATLAAFFIGLALGAWLLDKPIVRSGSPQRFYALLEAVIGVWALVSIDLIPLGNHWAGLLIGVDAAPWRHWLIAFLLPGLLLLPATFAMGGTLPAMERFLSARRRGGRHLAGIYAANTFGAMVGTLIVTFVVAPAWGYTRTLGLLAGLNLLCAAAANRYRCDVPVCLEENNTTTSGKTNRLYVILCATGLLGIGYEVLTVRVLSQILENTVYSFAALLAIYLLGTAVGAAFYQKRWNRSEPVELTSRLIRALSIACLVGIPLLLWVRPLYQGIHHMLPGLGGAVAAEMGIALLVFAGPTVLMGALFSHLAQQIRDKHGGVGIAFSINTLGGALAAPLFGIVLVPALGLKASLIVVGAGYLALAPRAAWRQARTYIPIALVGLVTLVPLSTHLVTTEDGEEIVAQREGLMGRVTVLRSVEGDMRLKVNDRFQMGGTASVFSDRRQGHLPLLLHRDPQRALFLGIGTGATLAAATEYPHLEAHGVELVPEVIDVMGFFTDSTGDLAHNPRIHLHIADARRFVNQDKTQYDVIVADLFHPARDGAGSLYTLEHFRAIRKRLEPDGLFCQWLPLYQMDLDTLAIVTRTFLDVFPETKAFLTHFNIDTPIIGLVGSETPLIFPTGWLEEHVTEGTASNSIRQYRLYNDYSLLGCMLADREDLVRWAGTGVLNTDDRPLVTYHTPAFVYGRPAPPYERLSALLKTFSPKPDQILLANQEPQARDRLAAYWKARDEFIRLGVSYEGRSPDAALIPALFVLIERSPDFAAAYNPLLSMAVQMAQADTAAATHLLRRMEQACPNRPEARRIREQIESTQNRPVAFR